MAKNKTALSLVALRWAKTTPEQRSAVAVELNKAKWGSKRPRCPCGEMTAKRAKARGHHCSK